MSEAWLVRRGARAMVVSMAWSACVVGAGAACSSFRNTDAEGSGTDAGGDAPSARDDGAAPSGDGGAPLGQDGSEPGSNDSSAVESGGGSDAGDVCTQTTCTVTPLISKLYGPAAIATDATYVYWLEVGSKIPQEDGSGEFVRLAKDMTCTDRSCVEVIDPYALSGTFEDELIYDNLVAVNADQACYSQSFNAQSEHAISCFALSSLTTKTSIDQDYGDCNSLWAGPASLVWSLASTTDTSSDGAIRSHAFTESDGGQAPAVATSRPNPTSVVADGTGVVWTESGLGDAGGAVMVAGVDGGVSSLAAGRGGPTAVAEYAGYIYWIDATARTVSRTARAGGGPIEQIANTDTNPFALVVDATGVYWAAAGLSNPTGSVAHAPLVPGGPTTVMMSDIVNITALAVDTTKVFVAALGSSVNGGGSIVMMNKTAP